MSLVLMRPLGRVIVKQLASTKQLEGSTYSLERLDKQDEIYHTGIFAAANYKW